MFVVNWWRSCANRWQSEHAGPAESQMIRTQHSIRVQRHGIPSREGSTVRVTERETPSRDQIPLRWTRMPAESLSFYQPGTTLLGRSSLLDTSTSVRSWISSTASLNLPRPSSRPVMRSRVVAGRWRRGAGLISSCGLRRCWPTWTASHQWRSVHQPRRCDSYCCCWLRTVSDHHRSSAINDVQVAVRRCRGTICGHRRCTVTPWRYSKGFSTNWQLFSTETPLIKSRFTKSAISTSGSTVRAPTHADHACWPTAAGPFQPW